MTGLCRQGKSSSKKGSLHGKDICHILSPPSSVPHLEAAKLQHTAYPLAGFLLSIQSSSGLQEPLLLQDGFLFAALEEFHRKPQQEIPR